MTRYKNDARLVREEQEIQELEKKTESVNTESENTEQKTLSFEEETFKKRYGDLRRYNQQLISEKDARIRELETQLANLPTGPQFPKTKEELEGWRSKYPDVFAHIQTMILQNNQELENKYKRGLEQVKQIEDQINRDKAVAELNRLHPDFFNKILPDPKFKEWAEAQPAWMIDALNGWDAIAASRVIDLYKADMGIFAQKEKPAPSRREAAESVTRTVPSGPDMSSDKPKYKESQIEKMSAREYEKLEDDIMEAFRTGRIEYDLTGAAR